MTPTTSTTGRAPSRFAAVPPAARAVVLVVSIRLAGLVGLVIGGAITGRDPYARLTRWDADWYARIATNGYGHIGHHPDGRLLSDYAFFPLYPMLERAGRTVLGLDADNAGLVVSWLAIVVAAWGIYSVGEAVAGRSAGFLLAGLWAALPMAAVLSMAYSEALFVALAEWSLRATLARRWVLAGVLAALAGLTRPLGVAVAAGVLVAALLAWREMRPRSVRPLVGAAIAPLGLVGYLGWVAIRRHELTGYFTVTRGWKNNLDGGRAFASWVGHFVTDGTWPVAVALVLAVALLAWLLVLSVRDRQPVALVVYSAVLLAMAFATSGYFGSKPRYLLPAFPLLLPLVVRLARKRYRWAVVGVLAAGSWVYGAVWLLGPGPP